MCDALFDIILGDYFIILERTGEKIEELEEELVSNPTHKTSQSIHKLRHEMIFLLSLFMVLIFQLVNL